MRSPRVTVPPRASSKAETHQRRSHGRCRPSWLDQSPLVASSGPAGVWRLQEAALHDPVHDPVTEIAEFGEGYAHLLEERGMIGWW